MSFKPLPLIYLVCAFCCASSARRTPASTEERVQRVEDSLRAFPEGADKDLPKVKKFTQDDLTLLAWSRDFARGHAVLIEIESSKNLDALRLFINAREYKLIDGDGCKFVLFANAPESKRKENNIEIRRNDVKIAEFVLPVIPKEYPVAKHPIVFHESTKPAEPMKKEIAEWIERSTKKKTQAFVSVDENFFSNELKYPRDEHKITSPFYIKRIYETHKRVKKKLVVKKSKPKYHGGTDLKGQVGAPIFAIADGVVNLADHLYFEGNMVLLDHGFGVMSGYMHQSELLVKEGERVKAGQQIGKSGATGRVNGPHLHILLYIHGVKVDALSLLNLPLRPLKK